MNFPTNYKNAINEFVKSCKKKLGKKLVSIVLFGSVARGTARKGSDIDILVIAKNLPKDWRERDNTLDDIVMEILLKYSIRVFPIIVESTDIKASARWPNPLFYGMLLGYNVIYDEGSFFKSMMKIVKERIRIKKPIYVEGGRKWELASMI